MAHFDAPEPDSDPAVVPDVLTALPVALTAPVAVVLDGPLDPDVAVLDDALDVEEPVVV